MSRGEALQSVYGVSDCATDEVEKGGLASQVSNRRTLTSEQKALVLLDNKANHALSVAAEYVMDVDRGTKEKTPEYYIRKNFSDNTYRSYRADYRDFVAWIGVENPLPVTAAIIGQYLADKSTDLAPTTLAHRVAALSFLHRLLGYDDPTQDAVVSSILGGIRKDRIEKGWRVNRAPAFNLEQFAAMIGVMGESLHDLRDRAFMLVALFGAFRESEITGLSVDQMEWNKQGVIITMDGAVKQDQEASQDRFKPIPYIPGAGRLCPATALHDYLEDLGITSGPVFRGIDRHMNVKETGISKNTANRIIQKWAARALLPKAERFSVHSCRASFVTVLRGMEVPDAKIARQTHHLNLATMQIYDRPEAAFADSPVTALAEAFGAFAGGKEGL